MTWRNRRKLSYLMFDFDDRNLVTEYVDLDNPGLIDMVLDFFINGSKLIYPAKSYFVAIVYAKCLEKYFNEPFYRSLNYDDLLPDDDYFVTYEENKQVYDIILKRLDLNNILELESTRKTIAYFKQEFLIDDGINNKNNI